MTDESVSYACTGCGEFKLTKEYSGRAGTPGEEEFDRITAPDECPACGAAIEEVADD